MSTIWVFRVTFNLEFTRQVVNFSIYRHRDFRFINLIILFVHGLHVHYFVSLTGLRKFERPLFWHAEFKEKKKKTF